MHGVPSWLQQLLLARRELGSSIPFTAHPSTVASCMGMGEPCFPPGRGAVLGQQHPSGPIPTALWVTSPAVAISWAHLRADLDPSELSPSSELTHSLPISGVS